MRPHISTPSSSTFMISSLTYMVRPMWGRGGIRCMLARPIVQHGAASGRSSKNFHPISDFGVRGVFIAYFDFACSSGPMLITTAFHVKGPRLRLFSGCVSPNSRKPEPSGIVNVPHVSGSYLKSGH